MVKQEEDDRLRLFAEALASSILAALRQGFAVTPGIEQIDLLAGVRKHRHVRRDYLAPVGLVSASRNSLLDVDWNASSFDILSLLDPELDIEPETMELHPISLRNNPAAEDLLRKIEDELLSRAPEARAG